MQLKISLFFILFTSLLQCAEVPTNKNTGGSPYTEVDAFRNREFPLLEAASLQRPPFTQSSITAFATSNNISLLEAANSLTWHEGKEVMADILQQFSQKELVVSEPVLSKPAKFVSGVFPLQGSQGLTFLAKLIQAQTGQWKIDRTFAKNCAEVFFYHLLNHKDIFLHESSAQKDGLLFPLKYPIINGKVIDMDICNATERWVTEDNNCNEFVSQVPNSLSITVEHSPRPIELREIRNVGAEEKLITRVVYIDPKTGSWITSSFRFKQ